MPSRILNVLTSPVLVGLVSVLQGCVSVDSDVPEAANDCQKIIASGSVPEQLDVDASVRRFLQAAVEFHALGSDLSATVKTACANISRDLGADDTWSQLGDTNDAISNGNRTGACDAANARISAIMEAKASANANFALMVTRGACHPDFKAQAACDAECKAQATCDSGSVETRCEPADLSVICEGTCNANAYCEGTADVAANCMGVCESTCQGECKGVCTAPNGARTENDPNCHGKCSSSCNGTCRGLCKVEAEQGISCGASVSCRGGCTGSYSEPKCTSVFTPPKCTVDQTCLDACSAEVAKNAVCDPPRVELIANTEVSADVKLLVDTINENLPDLFAVVDTQGKIALQAAKRLSATGNDVLKKVGDLDVKSAACAAQAVDASVQAAASLQVSVTASGNVTDSCRSHED